MNTVNKNSNLMPPRGRTKVRKSLLRRAAILHHALAIFDRRGFAHTSLDEIAKEAGLRREGIYYYFRNKSEILLHIIRPQSKALLERLKNIVDSEGSSRGKLYLAIHNHLMQFDRNCLEMTVSLRDVYLEGAGDVRREMNETWQAYESMWIRLVADGQLSEMLAALSLHTGSRTK